MNRLAVPNTIMFLILFVALVGCGSGNSDGVPNFQPVAINSASSEIITAAESGLPAFMEGMSDQWAEFGFASADELALARVGTPYQVCTLTNPGKSDQTIISTDRWEFPVMVNGSYRCMLRVDRIGNRWEAVSIGAAQLATWLQEAETDHPQLDFNNRAIVEVYGFSSAPYMIIGIDLSEEQPSFLLLPPGTESVRELPQYSTWASPDPAPVLSFEELYFIFRAFDEERIS